MTTPNQSSPPDIQQQLFLELDRKLRESAWASGASEAQGLLTGLACDGTTPETVRTRAFLLRLETEQELDLLEGMFALIARDLGDEELSYRPLLPDDSMPPEERAEAISGWCQGFLQGVFHDNTHLLEHGSEEIREALRDIMEIGHIELPADTTGDAVESDLLELEEFLRVAVQLIFEETQPVNAPKASSAIN